MECLLNLYKIENQNQIASYVWVLDFIQYYFQLPCLVDWCLILILLGANICRSLKFSITNFPRKIFFSIEIIRYREYIVHIYFLTVSAKQNSDMETWNYGQAVREDVCLRTHLHSKVFNFPQF